MQLPETAGQKIAGVPFDSRRGRPRGVAGKYVSAIVDKLIGFPAYMSGGIVKFSLGQLARWLPGSHPRSLRVGLRVAELLGLVERVAVPVGWWGQAVRITIGWAATAAAAAPAPALHTLREAPAQQQEQHKERPQGGAPAPAVTRAEIEIVRRAHRAAMLGRWGVEPDEPKDRVLVGPALRSREIAARSGASYSDAAGMLLSCWCQLRGHNDALTTAKHPIAWFRGGDAVSATVAAIARLKRRAAAAIEEAERRARASPAEDQRDSPSPAEIAAVSEHFRGPA